HLATVKKLLQGAFFISKKPPPKLPMHQIVTEKTFSTKLKLLLSDKNRIIPKSAIDEAEFSKQA
ncbi:MAG: hypothetical protein J6V00_03195, partial [Bacteroidaceae bacterium]|nr:hypothetical protein [Bacteroidaceae bacterium]